MSRMKSCSPTLRFLSRRTSTRRPVVENVTEEGPTSEERGRADSVVEFDIKAQICGFLEREVACYPTTNFAR